MIDSRSMDVTHHVHGGRTSEESSSLLKCRWFAFMPSRSAHCFSVGDRGRRCATDARTAYLLQDADGVPAAPQPRGEARRGGGVVVLGGLRQELTH